MEGVPRTWGIHKIEETMEHFEVLSLTATNNNDIDKDPTSEELLEGLLDRIDHCTEWDSDTKDNIARVFIENRDIFSEQPGLAKHFECQLKVKPYGAYYQKSYLISFTYHPPAIAEMNRMQDLGIIEPLSSQYSLPIVCVAEKDGTMRLCLDARVLNSISGDDCKGPDQIEQVLQTFSGRNVYSTIDLSAGYWQIQIALELRDYRFYLMGGTITSTT
ncbi:uncharacterized protein K02A2.6-like [Nilaparvata lugens]|uniref:uncharacterized protein K02A2.6-like n=1 Tax=Nilaparvata lugens TaxID=108931 RepID=UPI00193DF0DD|nr:uncharacterized protein K02A2.6-like [Nilaparvata lugens]